MFDRQKRAVVSALNLPEDVMLGDMFLSFTGNRGVLIENYRSIILYTDTALRLQGKKRPFNDRGNMFDDPLL